MKNKAIFYWPLVFILNAFISNAQCNDFVRIEGKKFKCGQSDFFAVVCNYETRIYHESNLAQNAPDVFPNHFAARSAGYTPKGNFQTSQITTQAQAYASMKKDFDYIKSLGFNTIRIGSGYAMTATSLPAWCDTNNGPYGPNTNAAAISSLKISASDFCSDDRRVIDISNNINLLLDITENVLNAAKEAGLKVIVITGEVSHVMGFLCGNDCKQNVIDGHVNYLSEFSKRFKYNSTLLAIDFGNEPDNAEVYPTNYDKNEVCAITKTWNDAVKNNSQILTTIGLMDIETSVSLWDADLLHLDFVSLHPYPGFNDPVNISDLSNVIEGMKSRYYWYSKYLKIPWMIGETCITAHKNNTSHPINYYNPWEVPSIWDPNPKNPGTIYDQEIYLDLTLNSCRDYGGLGYSWWAFMDANVCDYTPNCAGGAFWGVVNTTEPDNSLGGNPSTFDPKPAASKVTAFNPSIPPLSNPPIPSNYFNILNIPTAYSTSGIIKDQYNVPIKGALLIAKNSGVHIGQTFTNDQGEFTLYTNTYPVPSINISAFGCENYPTPIVYPPTNNNEWHLYKLYRPFIIQNKTYQSQNLYNANITEFVSNNADLSNNYNLFSGNLNITAGVAIHLASGFSAKYGSNFKARIGKYYDDCASVPFRPANEATVGLENNELENNLLLFPNPSKGLFTLKTPMDAEYKVDVYNILGALVHSISFNGSQKDINIEHLSQGVYNLVVRSKNNPIQSIKVIKE